MDHEAIFFQSLCAKAEEYVERLGIPIIEADNRDSRSEPFENSITYQLSGLTSYIEVSGFIQGCFLFSTEQDLANQFVSKYMIAPIPEAETANYAVEVTAEITNIIIGNSLINREEHDIFVGHPLMIVSKKAEIRPRATTVYRTKFTTHFGGFQCIFIPLDHSVELSALLAIEVD